MDSLFEGLVIIGIVAVSVLFAKSAKLVRPDQRMIVERLGVYNRTCGPGWHLIVPFVEKSIFLSPSEFFAWEAHGLERVRQIHQKPYRNAPARIDTKTSDPAAQPFLNPGERFLVFAILFGLGVAAFIVELKTGYQVDHKGRFAFSGWSITQVHGAWSWNEVWTHLPDELSALLFLPFCVLAFVAVELWYRFRSRK